MNEFSFVTFTPTIPIGCDIAIPINAPSDLAFFYETVKTMVYCDKLGTELGAASYTADASKKYVILSGDFPTGIDCFRLKITNILDVVFYSNLFRISELTETSLLKYSCNEAQFGFDYDIADSFNQLRLPIRLYNAQYPQKENVYIDSIGSRHVLYSKIDIEQLLETEYIPQSWHEKLIIALAHDNVWIDGVAMTKSNEYEIEWDEYIDTDCGDRLTKGSTKMQQNKTYRNSNCG